ncbi:MAG TPA: hypothetical protein VEO95_05350, partial [Chthoniobacteraceae bacterium]|nr:hypothetical protein [Chthoniobacteraceae bacterium]
RKNRFGDLKDQVSASGLQLVWPEFPKGWWENLTTKRNMIGIIVTAALLSLGAPFWYNVLRQMTSLRPLLANLVEQRPSQTSPPPAGEKKEDGKGT